MLVQFCIALILCFSVIFQANSQALEDIEEQAPPSRNAKVVLGEKLFFDKSLSTTGETSCASCHSPGHGWAEPRPVSIFDNAKHGPRNAPSLLDVALRPNFMWDGRFSSLEEQASGPFGHAGEMGISIEEAARRLEDSPEYRDLFEAAFQDRPTPPGIAQSIAAFERTIVTGPSRFDRFFLMNDRHALSPQETLGFDIFIGKGNCIACHRLQKDLGDTPPLFSDFKFRNLGVGFRQGRFEDLGLEGITGHAGDKGAFRTPSLRNVALTPPYMHDGSLASLREAVEFYNAGGLPNPNRSPLLRPLGLSPDEKSALVAFLNSLTSEDLEERKRFAHAALH